MLLTKIHIPSPGGKLVQRSSLFDKLNEGLKRKLILISAPAGFGKTCLLCDWIDQNKIPTAWYSLDKSDNDPVVFLSYIIYGIQKISDEFGVGALQLLKSPNKPSYESVASMLINEMLDLKQDLLLVLDDFHLISNSEISKFVAFILEYIPDHIHIAILTRSDPSLPLARIRSQHQMLELRSSDLSFSAQDISVLFNKKLKISLSNDDAYSLETKTEGWIAGLQLTAISLQDREDTSDFIRELKGDNRYIMDYLIEEVLKVQTDDVKEFLLQTSLLEQVSASLCNAVLNRNDSQEVLEKLEKNNMFVIPLDSGRKWYRYHHLFAELLKHRLLTRGTDSISELHSKASDWFNTNKMPSLAIEHSIQAGDFEKSIQLIGGIVEHMWENGQHSAIMKYGESLPRELIENNPEFCLYYAWILTVSGDLENAEPLLGSAKRTIIQQIDKKEISEEDRLRAKKLLGKISVAFAYLYAITAESDKILEHCKIAMDHLSEEDLLWYSWALFSNGTAKLGKKDLAGSIADLTKALEYGKQTGNIYLMSTIVIRLSIIMHRLGEYKMAYKLCTELLSSIKERGYSQIVEMDWTFAGLFSNMAMMQFMWAELDEALDNIKKAYELSKYESNIQVRYVVLFGYSMVMRGIGDLHGSLEKINEMDELLRDQKVTPQQKSTYTAWKGYVLIELKQFEKAKALFKGNGQGVDQEIDYNNEHSYMAYVNLLLEELKIDEAEIVLSKLFALAKAGNRLERLHELKIFYAVVNKLKSKREEAIQCLIEAMQYVVANDIVMYFILYFDKIDDLLEETFKTLATTKNSIPKEYIDKLKLALEKREKRENITSESDLSPRELDTLKLIAENLTNQEVADKLFISLNTVKTHLKNINIKLEVDNRIKAVAKARQLGVL